MLAELRQAHEELLAALADLDRLTGAEVPDEPALASARLRLGRSSGKRRRLVDAACTMLLETASPEDARRLRLLRERNSVQLEASTKHIGHWGLRQVVADWSGYRQVAAGMRQSQRDLIAADREVLYPLLGAA